MNTKHYIRTITFFVAFFVPAIAFAAAGSIHFTTGSLFLAILLIAVIASFPVTLIVILFNRFFVRRAGKPKSEKQPAKFALRVFSVVSVSLTVIFALLTLTSGTGEFRTEDFIAILLIAVIVSFPVTLIATLLNQFFVRRAGKPKSGKQPAKFVLRVFFVVSVSLAAIFAVLLSLLLSIHG